MSTTHEPKTLFILGATGYIGGAVLKALHAAYPSITITALARPQTLAVPGVKESLLSSGITTLLPATHAIEFHPLIHQQILTSDIVLNCADADDLPLTQTILKAMLQRSEDVYIRGSGPKPILIHTSGTGVLSDTSSPPGSLTPTAKEKIYNDNEPDMIRNDIAPTQPHRVVDLEIFRAGATGLINAYIIAPCTIYGRGDGPVRKVSIQIPKFIRVAIRRRQVVVIGEGTNLWNNVHIKDLTTLYVLVFQLALRTQGDSTIDPYEKWFFGSVATHEWGAVAKLLAVALKKRGLVDTEEVGSVTREEEKLTASNSRSISERGFALGWKPTHPSLEDTIEEDIDVTLEADQSDLPTSFSQ